MSVRKRTWKTRQGEMKEAWLVDYVDQGGNRHARTFARKKDADAYHATVKVDVARGIHTSTKVTVGEAAEKWLTSASEHLERTTIENYSQVIRNHIAPFLGMVPLSQLTVPRVRDFMDHLRKEGRSTDMVRRVITTLGTTLGDAQERGLIAQNVIRSLGKHQHRRHKARHRKLLKVGVDIPSPAEIRTIIAHLRGQWRPLFLTAIFTGLRASELRGLRWEDLDLRNACLHVHQRADRYKNIGKPKSAAGRRTVPLPPKLIKALRDWKMVCPKGELGLVFPTKKGTVQHLSSIVNNALKPVQVAAGVVNRSGKAKYPMHSLRHFYASWCINRKEEGGLSLPLKMVQARLGHATLQMTADTYGHLFPSSDTGSELAKAERILLG